MSGPHANGHAPTPIRHDTETPVAASMERLYSAIECLCSHVAENTAVQAESIKQTELLRNRLEQIFGQLDRMELFAARQSGYPDTQARIAGAEQIRQRIIKDGQEARVREALAIVAQLLTDANEGTS